MAKYHTALQLVSRGPALSLSCRNVLDISNVILVAATDAMIYCDTTAAYDTLGIKSEKTLTMLEIAPAFECCRDLHYLLVATQ